MSTMYNRWVIIFVNYLIIVLQTISIFSFDCCSMIGICVIMLDHLVSVCLLRCAGKIVTGCLVCGCLCGKSGGLRMFLFLNYRWCTWGPYVGYFQVVDAAY